MQIRPSAFRASHLHTTWDPRLFRIHTGRRLGARSITSSSDPTRLFLLQAVNQVFFFNHEAGDGGNDLKENLAAFNSSASFASPSGLVSIRSAALAYLTNVLPKGNPTLAIWGNLWNEKPWWVLRELDNIRDNLCLEVSEEEGTRCTGAFYRMKQRVSSPRRLEQEGCNSVSSSEIDSTRR